MDELPTAETPAPVMPSRSRDGTGVWMLVLLVGAAVCVSGVSGRWKPIVAFPIAMGCVVALCGLWLRSLLGLETQRWHAGFIALLAGVTTLAAFVVAAAQQPSIKPPDNPLARQLLEAVDRQAAADQRESQLSARWSVWQRYAARRYALPSSVANTLAACGEAVLSAVIAAVGLRSRRVAGWFGNGTTP